MLIFCSITITTLSKSQTLSCRLTYWGDYKSNQIKSTKIIKCWFLEGGENRNTGRKISQRGVENMTGGIEPRPRWRKTGALITTSINWIRIWMSPPPLPPLLFFSVKLPYWFEFLALKRNNNNNVLKNMDNFVMFTCFLGECIGRFTNRKIPYCVKFNPDEVLSFNVFFFNFLPQELKNLRKEVLVFIVTFLSNLHFSQFSFLSA